MSNKIEIDISNWLPKNVEALTNLIERSTLQPPKPWWEETQFDIHNNDRFYTMAHDGSVCTLTNRNWATDKEAISFGNACKDRSYMEQRAKDIRRANLIANFAHVVNGDWEADWSDKDICKYYIFYEAAQRKWRVRHNMSYKVEGVTYFKSAEDAQRCIDEIILPLERGEL